MSIISCKGLTKIYVTGAVRVEALRGIDLEIDQGEMVAIMGPSGCGKTTLLNCLSGLDDVTTGKIMVENTDITTLDDDKKTIFRANRMGFVFQFYNLLPVLTATENVELPLLISGVRDADARGRAEKMLDTVGLRARASGRAEKMLDTVGLRARASMRPSSLSGGERQRVAIARALVNDPAIVFADEPTGDLDKKTADDVMNLLRQLNREHGQTFVIVTHDPEVGARCDRIIHMRDGLVVSKNGIVSNIAREIEEQG